VAFWTSEDDELALERGDGRPLFRLIHGEESSPEDWRSHYENKHRPLEAEMACAAVYMGVSMWSQPEVAQALAKKYPRIGDHLAVVRLNGEIGIWFAATNTEGHYTVWGRPSDLRDSTDLPAEPV
jgi:hypothetical protein